MRRPPWDQAQFALSVANMRTRVAALRRASTRSDTGPRLIADEALEELGSSLEELRVAEEELRRQTEVLARTQFRAEDTARRFETLFWHLPGTHLVTDDLGVITRTNRARSGLFDPEGVRGKPIALFVPFDDRARFQQWLREFFESRASAATTTARWLLADRHRSLPCELRVARNGDRPVGPDALLWSLAPLTAEDDAREATPTQVRVAAPTQVRVAAPTQGRAAAPTQPPAAAAAPLPAEPTGGDPSSPRG